MLTGLHLKLRTLTPSLGPSALASVFKKYSVEAEKPRSPSPPGDTHPGLGPKT